ncbi:acetyl-CoA acetyltransferase [Brevibacillus nitrificans]|uniref:Acetyl-CoA acetyltransferase n=1 Tax=Brevibacillus nitrificans TaxID=651560 RepID=A0A3M8DKQ3_9BACL|nr:acetyl-CoA acetyltransferase [Brevibacillus nitrificans]RNB88613.1 acetyl-CoA acetyltransferase [Brevibacillus nitrificans]
MRKVAIIGAAQSKWGVLTERTLHDLIAEVGNGAIRNAGISRGAIQAIYLGNVAGGELSQQFTLGSVAAHTLGIPNIPAQRYEAACSTGAVSFREAYLAVANSVYDFALAIGVEKLNVNDMDRTVEVLSRGFDSGEGRVGLLAPSQYALYATAHMHKYGTTREQLAMVAEKNYYHGSLNPDAHIRKRYSVEDVLHAPMISDPLGRHDCSLVTDGAAAVILCPLEMAQAYHARPIEVLASAVAGETSTSASRESYVSFGCTRRAVEAAYQQAKLGPGDISFAETHDCFTITEIINIEDLGFVPKGEGGPAVQDGLTRLGGRLPVNVSGGLKAKGHAVGATGIGQIYEAVIQLRHEAGERQVSNAEVALTHMLGGSPAISTVHIFQRGY